MPVWESPAPAPQSLVQHAMNILGATRQARSPVWLIRGRKVTRIDWRGCMANVRHVEAVGVLERRESRWTVGYGGKCYKREELPPARLYVEHPGIVVRYPEGERWESLTRVRIVGRFFGNVEIWL